MCTIAAVLSWLGPAAKRDGGTGTPPRGRATGHRERVDTSAGKEFRRREAAVSGVADEVHALIPRDITQVQRQPRKRDEPSTRHMARYVLIGLPYIDHRCAVRV